jgi:hypothetical protein
VAHVRSADGIQAVYNASEGGDQDSDDELQETIHDSGVFYR